VFARARHFLLGSAVLVLACPLAWAVAEPQAEPAPLARLSQSLARAEAALQRNDLATAESEYRAALFEGFSLLGVLEGIAGREQAARDALAAAADETGDDPARLLELGTDLLRVGDAAGAQLTLSKAVAGAPGNGTALRLLARALVATGDVAGAFERLEAASGHTAGDPELAFHIATDYLQLKRPDAAARLFAEVVKARPIPQSHVLIGRSYRDASEYERARGELRAALAQDPRVRHAHYYLGMVQRADPRTGPERLDEAIAEFRAELKLAPRDPLTNDQLGLALLESDRYSEALPALETAVREEARPLYVYHLGRALVGLDRTTEAELAFRRALSLATPDEADLDKIHYQLGLVLRRLGRLDDANAHLEAAREAAALRLPAAATGTGATGPLIEASPLAERPAAERAELSRRIVAGLAGACSNLGVMRAQQGDFEAAAERFSRAAELDPDRPQVQASLGIAWFNSRQFAKATGPLQKASTADPNDAGVRRMLALAWLNTQAFDKAAELLRDDPQREADASLDFAYAMALVKSDRSVEAEPVFERLLARHGASPELSVLVGQAHAQQGDYDGAIATLQHALEIKPDVHEAQGTLGVIYLKQGRLPEAEAAFRAELASNSGDILTRHNLGNVLELQGRPKEAEAALREVLAANPQFVDSRYLLGKILLARGAAREAIEELKSAARLAPQDANIHYQLAQAFQKSGEAALAEQEFEAFRKLKDTKRGATP
jgi:tetratricopeptide (TPR) repeat protein